MPETAVEQNETPARSKARIELLAFDLDGTLVDSAPDLNYCLGRALGSLGFSAPTETQTLGWIGDGVEELVRKALGDASADAEALLGPALEAFTACYADNLFVRSRLYPSAAKTLRALSQRGLRLACVTNKRARFAEGVLTQAGILGFFELVLGGDSLPEKKPSPAPLLAASERLGVAASAAAFVGDSDHDLRAARAAGWRFIWAAYGYRRELQLDGAAFTIARLADLETAI